MLVCRYAGFEPLCALGSFLIAYVPICVFDHMNHASLQLRTGAIQRTAPFGTDMPAARAAKGGRCAVTRGRTATMLHASASTPSRQLRSRRWRAHCPRSADGEHHRRAGPAGHDGRDDAGPRLRRHDDRTIARLGQGGRGRGRRSTRRRRQNRARSSGHEGPGPRPARTRPASAASSRPGPGRLGMKVGSAGLVFRAQGRRVGFPAWGIPPGGR